MQYATVQELKAYPTGVDYKSISDEGLDLLLQAASEYIDAECGHGPGAFIASESEERTFDGNGKDLLLLPYAVSVTAVAVDGAAWTTGRWVPYRLYHQGPIYAVAAVRGLFSRGRQNVAVTGVWGYSSSVPAGIRQATILQAANFIKEKGAQAFRMAGNGGASPGYSSGRTKIDTTINELIRNFRRPIP